MDPGDGEVGTAEAPEALAEAEELPDMLELISQAEAAAGDPAALAEVLVRVGRRIRAVPEDREALSDWEGIDQICGALAAPPHQWRGQAMLAFCSVMPDVCKQSAVNRGALRDAGFVSAAVELLRAAIPADAAAATLASLALAALCTANNGNKEAAAAALGEDPEAREGAPALLLRALAAFPASLGVHTEALAALHSLVADDDGRGREAAMEAPAQENLQLLVAEDAFPLAAGAVVRALDLADGSGQPQVKLREQALLLTAQMAREEVRTRGLAIDAGLLGRVAVAMGGDIEPRVARAGLAALRAFARLEEAKEELAVLSDGALTCVALVRRHLATPTVCEQGFGLFANLTARKPEIVARLAGEGVLALGLAALRQHPERPNVAASVVQALRNVVAQDEGSAAAARDAELFQELRALVLKRQGEAGWRNAVENSRQLLREFREDEGVQKAPQYNAYY